MTQEILPPEKSTSQKILDSAVEQQDYADRELVRMNLIDVANEAVKGIQNLSAVAEQSNHPRAYEALAKLIDSATNVNKAIVETQFARKQMEIEMDIHSNNPGGPANITNHNSLVFNGSTSELLELLKNKNT